MIEEATTIILVIATAIGVILIITIPIVKFISNRKFKRLKKNIPEKLIKEVEEQNERERIARDGISIGEGEPTIKSRDTVGKSEGGQDLQIPEDKKLPGVKHNSKKDWPSFS